MKEREWLKSEQPGFLVSCLQRQLSERKKRLFAVACCRRIWHLLVEGYRQTVLRVEHLAEDTPQRADWAAARKSAIAEAKLQQTGSEDENWLGYWAVIGAAHARPNDAARQAAHQAQRAMACAAAEAAHPGGWDKLRAWHSVYDVIYFKEARIQAELLRDIVNPFHPVQVEERWLTRRVVAAAEAAYEKRSFDRLPTLADILKRAGCTDPAILDHLRGPGPHVRGCFVIDALLGKS